LNIGQKAKNCREIPSITNPCEGKEKKSIEKRLYSEGGVLIGIKEESTPKETSPKSSKEV